MRTLVDAIHLAIPFHRFLSSSVLTPIFRSLIWCVFSLWRLHIPLEYENTDWSQESQKYSNPHGCPLSSWRFFRITFLLTRIPYIVSYIVWLGWLVALRCCSAMLINIAIERAFCYLEATSEEMWEMRNGMGTDFVWEWSLNAFLCVLKMWLFRYRNVPNKLFLKDNIY